MSIYQEIILDHYQFPHNHGVLPDPDAQCSLANPTCGDSLRMTINLHDTRISDCKFDGQACAISTASASLLTDFVQQKTIDEVMELTAQDILTLLNIELSPIRLKCALLPLEGIQTALREVK
jgi:nitrogen fixation protein NifU and related proteins